MALAIDPEALSQKQPSCPALPAGTELLPVAPPPPPLFGEQNGRSLATPCEAPKPCRCRPALAACGPKPTAPERAPQPGSLDIGIAGGATVGLLPETALMVEQWIGATYAEQIQLRVLGRYWKQQETVIPGYRDASAQLRMWSVSPRGCWRPYRPSWIATLCTGPEAGQLTSLGVGSSFRSSDEPSDTWWGWTGSLGLEVPLGRPLFVETSLDGGVAVSRPDIGFLDDGRWVRVAQPERFYGSLLLAVGAHLP